jgi:tetratricopeptide (TPR) repeat protein
MNLFSGVATSVLFALLLASPASATVTLYSGTMELVAVSGSGCAENDRPGTRIPLELTLEQTTSSDGQHFAGYYSGTDLQSGRFSGTELERLQVAYPDEPDRFQDNSLALRPGPQGIDGELQEKSQPGSDNCYFSKAIIQLKKVATGSQAEAVYLRQDNLYHAEAHFMSGQSLLRADKPKEAMPELSKSLELRNRVDPGDPGRALPVVLLAIAELMDGRETKALSELRGLLADSSKKEDVLLKQRATAAASLCSAEQNLESDAGQKASLQLMDIVAREFGRREGMTVPLAACYFEIAKERKEQGDPDLAIELFQKVLQLVPDHPDSITGVAMSYVDEEAPAEGLRFLKEHAAVFEKAAGKESYNILLSYLYAAEAEQNEKSGDLPHAEALFREAVKANPGDRTPRIELARLLARERKIPEAQQLLGAGSLGCRDQTCRQEYADELARLAMIERLVKRLETHDEGRKGINQPGKLRY